MSSNNSKTIVVTVSTILARDKLMKRIYTNLTKEPSTQFIIVKDQVNRIRVFHKVSSDIRVLICTYLAVVIPVTINLKLLDNIYGVVDFHLDETIKHLQTLITKLQGMRGRRIVKGNNDGKTLEQLVNLLS